MLMGMIEGSVVVAASGGSPSAAVLGAAFSPDTSGAGTSFTLPAQNWGTGSKFIVIHFFTQAGGPITAVTVNGASFTPGPNNFGGGALGDIIFYGTATVTTTTSIVVTSTTSMSFGDFNCLAWALSNLSSTTPAATSNGTGGSSTVTVAALVGDLIFSQGLNGGSAGNFTGSAQAPTTPQSVGGASNLFTTAAYWLAAGGVSGGNFTATFSVGAQPIAASWR